MNSSFLASHIQIAVRIALIIVVTSNSTIALALPKESQLQELQPDEIEARGASPVSTGKLASELHSIVKRFDSRFGKGASLSVSVKDLAQDGLVFNNNGESPVLPASVLKLLTTYVALRELGGEFKFQTSLFADHFPGQTGDVGALYVRGSGDPSLVSEDVLILADELKRIGVKIVDEIVIDDSAFTSSATRTGFNPYQAAQSALSFNQNCISIRIFPTVKGQPAKVSPPDGTGIKITNRMQTVSGAESSVQISEAGSPEQSLIISGTVGEQSTGETLYWTVEDPRLNFSEVFRSMLSKHGITIKAPARAAVVPPNAKKLVTHSSRDLSFILADLNRYSSNFIANQIVYTLGCDATKHCDFKRGLERIKKILVSRGITGNGMVLEDGSGLSRADRVTTRQLLDTLTLAHGEFDIFPDYVSSLSHFSHTGTLKNRRLGSNGIMKATAENVWAKTGTIDGVSSLAGYLQSNGGRRYAFVIISNGSIQKSDAEIFENEIVATLARGTF